MISGHTPRRQADAELAQERRGAAQIELAFTRNADLVEGGDGQMPEAGLAAKDFRACREPDTRSACSKCGEERAIWLELAAIARAMASGFSVLALEVEL